MSLLAAMQVPAEAKKMGHKLESKDTATGSTAMSTAQKTEGILKFQKENMPRYDSTSAPSQLILSVLIPLSLCLPEKMLLLKFPKGRLFNIQ